MASVPAFTAPPLPAGWTEHRGPSGHAYYYNAQTKESTYVRPLPAPAAAAPAPTKAKEKPLVKTAIPGTDWIRVRTTEGNTFYSNKATKKSSWTIPEEIKDQVLALDIKENPEVSQPPPVESAKAKRKAEEVKRQAKRSRVDEDRNVEVIVITGPEHEEADDDDDDDESSDGEEDDPEYQRAVAQMEAEAEALRVKEAAEEERKAEEKRKLDAAAKLVMPSQVDLSLDEAKALFKTLLREKDINPLHPWDQVLPIFVNDPRYVLLPSVATRRDAFDEYCRERTREIRAATVQNQTEEAADPKQLFDKLLKDEVKSTRTSWNDFRREWKKDRRFWGWGRDDREREKRFKEHLKQMGEVKRQAAQKAERDFFTLLRDHRVTGGDWKDVKRSLVKDPRYDAVGSSSLREELYQTFLKAQDNGPIATDIPESTNGSQEESALSKQERKERAVREREAHVHHERSRVEAQINRSRQGLDQEEGERTFRTMLTDAIREPQTTWEASVEQLSKDHRFTSSPLSAHVQRRLFEDHIGQLRSKHVHNLHGLFAAHAPSLATVFASLPLQSLLTSSPVSRLGYGEEELEREFNKWQRERTQEARLAFDAMLAENSFVEFWGRLNKIEGQGANEGVQAEDLPEDEGEHGGGQVDMKTLAKSINVDEIASVLKGDKRYISFDHIPEQRETWVRDHLANMSAPELSVHAKTNVH